MPGFARVLGSVLVVGILAVGAAPTARAADEPTVIVVRLFPTEGREDEAQARFAKLVKFVPANNPGVTFRLHRSIKKPVVHSSTRRSVTGCDGYSAEDRAPRIYQGVRRVA